LEVRALDTEHVYVRVSWLNRPEDLKGGRQDYHGKNELVPTNQMDVINAQAVNGTFVLIHYDQLKDENRRSGSGKDIYFWRQTFNFTTRRLSVILVTNHARSDISINTLTDPQTTMLVPSCRLIVHLPAAPHTASQEYPDPS
jgi:hypothetical protein